MNEWLFAYDSYLKMPYQDKLAALIHEPTFKDTLEVVARLDVDNFFVRPKRRFVERHSDRERLAKLAPADVLDIDQNLAGLPYSDDDEEMARRFDLLRASAVISISPILE